VDITQVEFDALINALYAKKLTMYEVSYALGHSQRYLHSIEERLRDWGHAQIGREALEKLKEMVE
jgi:hypothetical protein